MQKQRTDWEAHFSRPLEDFLAESAYNQYNEYIEFMLIELIKLSQHATIVADVFIPLSLLTQISEPHRIACMLAQPELVTCENYGKREDHREFLECLLSLKEPEKKIAVQDALFKINTEKMHEEARQYNVFSLVRNEDSNFEERLKLIEKHFNL